MNVSGAKNELTIAVGLAKAAGAVGLGLIAYDSHIAGKIESVQHAKNHKAESLSEHYLDDLKLDSPSIVKDKVKKGLFHYHMDENLTDFFTGVGGYVSGFGSMLVGNIVPLTLATGAVLTKGTFSKLFGAGLVGYGAIFLIQEFFGIGKTK